MRILFMGTPEFAVPCLEQLIRDGNHVVGVVTQPDKPKGRGHKLTPPPIKEVALKNQIPVFQPETLKNNAFSAQLEELQPDLIIVVAYGKILPVSILNFPKYGCVNVHASLLPKYRGAGPIQWSVINGEPVTGVTTMYMDKGLDTGDMILKKEITIGEDETAGVLHDRMSLLGAQALRETVELIKSGKVPREKQSEEQTSYAPMLDKSIALIDWSKPAAEIKNLVRGLNPWPIAYTFYKGTVMKVFRVSIGETNQEGVPGTIIDNCSVCGLKVQAGQGTMVIVREIQCEGGKRMGVEEYMRGHSIECGEILGKNDD